MHALELLSKLRAKIEFEAPFQAQRSVKLHSNTSIRHFALTLSNTFYQHLKFVSKSF